MPNGTHTVELQVPIGKIWNFVQDMNNWAPLVPGYIHHEIVSENQSTWEFKGDLGLMKKKIKLQVDITEWLEPTKVTFNLKELSDNFSGNGYFEAEVIDANSTRMTGHLDISAGGMIGAVTNTVLKKIVPDMATELTDTIAAKINEIEGVTV